MPYIQTIVFLNVFKIKIIAFALRSQGSSRFSKVGTAFKLAVFDAETVKQSGLAGAALLMPQADYFSTVITLLSPLCRSGLWGLMDTAMYNSLIISI